jgi:hypothetical protein
MFPRYSQTDLHGSEALSWAAYILINLGLVMRLISEPLNDIRKQAFWGWLLIFSALLH